METSERNLLKIRDLRGGFRHSGGLREVLHGVDLELAEGESLSLVGESGSGKTFTAQSILRLYSEGLVYYSTGRIRLDGREIFQLDALELARLRGRVAGMIFQEPLSSLNPLHTIEKQLCESVVNHQSLPAAEVSELCLLWLNKVGLRHARKRLRACPHQLSGGERQRVMIAMAMINRPRLLIADEPTTALDVTLQAEILRLIGDLQAETGMGLLFVTHNLEIVRRFAGRVAVMKDGFIVEQGETAAVFSAPEHEYTGGLLKAEPGRVSPRADVEAGSIAEFRDVRVNFEIRRGFLRRVSGVVKAVDGVSARIPCGQTLGLVGESGSGKTTLGKALVRLEASQGDIFFEGRAIDGLKNREMRPYRRRIQIIFQDPFSSLSPRMSVNQIIREGLDLHKTEVAGNRDEAVIRVMEEVGLDPDTRHRYPHEFSGGQRQRVALARALVLKPQLLVLDEPTSSLDRSIQFQVVELLKGLQEKHGLSYLFISHDMALVRHLCHFVAVMKEGRIVEMGTGTEIFSSPGHPYTVELLQSAFA